MRWIHLILEYSGIIILYGRYTQKASVYQTKLNDLSHGEQLRIYKQIYLIHKNITLTVILYYTISLLLNLRHASIEHIPLTPFPTSSAPCPAAQRSDRNKRRRRRRPSSAAPQRMSDRPETPSRRGRRPFCCLIATKQTGFASRTESKRNWTPPWCQSAQRRRRSRSAAGSPWRPNESRRSCPSPVVFGQVTQPDWQAWPQRGCVNRINLIS